SRRRHTSSTRDWSSDVCSSDLRRASIVVVNSLGIGDQATVHARAALAAVLRSTRAGAWYPCDDHRHSQVAALSGARPAKSHQPRSEERRGGKEGEYGRSAVKNS